MNRVWIRTAVVLVALAIVVVAAAFADAGSRTGRKADIALQPLAPAGVQGSNGARALSNIGRKSAVEPVISSGEPVAPAEFNGDVRDLPQEAPSTTAIRPELEGPAPSPGKQTTQASVPVVPKVPSAMPTPIRNFPGLDHDTWGAGYPPDTVGDVGPNHYIQAVNTSIGIYSKTGTPLAAMTFNTLFSGTGTPCDSSNQGDPTVIYDSMANRWIVGDFAWGPTTNDFLNGPYYQCIAVSKTNDPVVGGWWLYGIDAVSPVDTNTRWLNDYPKMGIWPDGLYVSANMFDLFIGCAGTCIDSNWTGVRVWAFDRTDLEAGLPVDNRIVDLGTSGCASFTYPCHFGLLPSHLTGTLPPAGRDNLLVAESQVDFKWEVFKFNVDYVGAGTTFAGPTNVSQTVYPFPSFPPGFPLVPTPVNRLDSLADRAMMQNQYKNIGGVESLWVNHTVPVNANNGLEVIQWGQINVTGGTVSTTPVQEQIYNLGDGHNRWMGSLAVDKVGNMAIGYSVANSTNNPDIRYSGRLASDPLNTLAQGEAELINGTGTQTNTCGGATCTRWGDYSAMTIDPVDGCTFWYTTEYYAVNGGNWQTRIGSFRYPSGPCPPTAVTVKTFDARRTRSGTAVVWRTGSEANALGFNLYRNAAAQRWTKLNRSLLLAKPAVGAVHRFLDRTAEKGRAHTYRLQVVDHQGKRSWYGIGVAAH
jgi:hypothetical protein